MNWLARLLQTIAPPATGIEVDEPNPIAVSVSADAGGFIRAIGLLADSNAILYWEGRTSRTLAAWLDRQTLEPRPAVSIGIAPVADFYHLQLNSDLLDELAVRVNQPGAIRRPIRLHVRQADRIILQWRRAFGAEPALVSRELRPGRDPSVRRRRWSERCLMNPLIRSIESEYRRYQGLAEAALAQVPEPLLSTQSPGDGNSLATICWHVSGNLKSRFTDFLTSDGEKAWRHRDEEFTARTVGRDALLVNWREGWDVLWATLGQLTDDDLPARVTIRAQPLAVHEALHRSLAHVSYHVGQIVYLARTLSGPEWKFLSIPPGQSDAFNASLGVAPPVEPQRR